MYRHAFDSKASSLAPYEFRRRMCQLAFRDRRRSARRDGVKVLDIEKIVVEAALDRARAKVFPRFRQGGLPRRSRLHPR